MRARSILVAAALGAVAALVAAGGARAQEVYHDNVVIILDASGSMEQRMRRTRTRKMDAAKAALKEVLATVPETTHIGLLVFSADNLKDDWAYPLGPRDDARLMKVIDLPLPGGRTPLGAYIKKGADRLLKERAEQLGYGSYRLLVVTDGEAQDPDLVRQYTPEVIARGITVDVIGVDMQRAHTLATKVNSYRSADDPASLRKAVAEVFAEVGGAGTDAAGDEAFDLIAPIPDEVAKACLNALSTSGNHPIGELSPVGRREAVARARARAGQRAATSPPVTSGGGSGATSAGVIAFVVVVIGVIIAKSVGARKKRSGF